MRHAKSLTVVPEKHKKPGLCYVLADDGIELPVIDITHPAFALEPSEEELRREVERALSELERVGRMPPLARRLLLALSLKGSRLAAGIRSSAGTYLSGMSTYLLKLGPDNLGRCYAKRVDRRIAASLPCLSVQLRLKDTARLLADGLKPLLARDSARPLYLLNLGGGCASDTLNALVLLSREERKLIAARQVSIDVLDRDEVGPAFGGRALLALRAEAAPLHGLSVALRPVALDWSDGGRLRELLEAATSARAIIAVASEGGLFEYGSDEEIEACLALVARYGPEDVVVVGSVTRIDGAASLLNRASQAAMVHRGLPSFEELARRSGFRVHRRIDRPLSHNLALARG